MSVIEYTPANDDHEDHIDDAFIAVSMGDMTEVELIEIISTPGAYCVRCDNWEDHIDKGDICTNCDHDIEGTDEEW